MPAAPQPSKSRRRVLHTGTEGIDLDYREVQQIGFFIDATLGTGDRQAVTDPATLPAKFSSIHAAQISEWISANLEELIREELSLRQSTAPRLEKAFSGEALPTELMTLGYRRFLVAAAQWLERASSATETIYIDKPRDMVTVITDLARRQQATSYWNTHDGLGDGVGAQYSVVADQAAFRYSLMRPSQRDRRVIRASGGAALISSSFGRGGRWLRERCGRWVL